MSGWHVSFCVVQATQDVGLTAAERKLRSQIAAHESWARTVDRTARTANARRALLDKFEREADPNDELSPAERARRAESLRKAFYARMALKSARARRRRGAMVRREEGRP
jgi:membrane-bound lytic murein transglycosylase B